MKIPLFDLDGTIFKSHNTAHNDAYDYAFKKVYKTNASQKGFNLQGMTDKQLILKILTNYGLSKNSVEEKIYKAEKAMVNYFYKNFNSADFSLLPGVKDLLINLKRTGMTLGLLTGNIEEIGWKKLEIAGIKDFFDFGAFGGVTDKRVELVKIAKERADKKFKTDFPIKTFVIVGDTPKDIACAREAGISVIAVSTGNYSFEDLGKNSPDLLIHSFEEKDKVTDFLTK